MINVSEVIDELKYLLDHCVAEETLSSKLRDKLTILRQAYLADKTAFAPEHISFLKNLSENITRQLFLFIELKEELPNIYSVEEHLDVKARLVSVKTELHGLPVSKRVSKEIRELDERLPSLKEQEQIRLQSKVNGRIYDLERDAPHCSRGHVMVVRESHGSHFWACSKYPMHEETKSMSPQEKAYLSN
jgi:hypothetical protein